MSGIELGKLFRSCMEGCLNDGTKLQEKMKVLEGGSLDQTDLLEIQFMMGQYNAKLEAISSITKSLEDMLKSIAQRVG